MNIHRTGVQFSKLFHALLVGALTVLSAGSGSVFSQTRGSTGQQSVGDSLAQNIYQNPYSKEKEPQLYQLYQKQLQQLSPTPPERDITVEGNVSLGSSMGVIAADTRSFIYSSSTRGLSILRLGCPVKMGEVLKCRVQFLAVGDQVAEILSARALALDVPRATQPQTATPQAQAQIRSQMSGSDGQGQSNPPSAVSLVNVDGILGGIAAMAVVGLTLWTVVWLANNREAREALERALPNIGSTFTVQPPTKESKRGSDGRMFEQRVQLPHGGIVVDRIQAQNVSVAIQYFRKKYGKAMYGLPREVD